MAYPDCQCGCQILGWDISADMQTFLLKEGSAGAATFNSSATATVPPTSPRPTSADETGQTNRRGSIMLGSSTAARQSTPSIRSGHSSHHEKKSGGFLSSLRNKRIKPLGGSNNRDDSTTVTGRGRSQSSATETYGPIDEDDIPPVPRQRGQSTPPPASPTVESDEVAETSVLNRPTIQATKGSAGLLSASTGNAGTGNKRESKLPSFLQRKSSNTALFADGSASTGDARLSSEPTTPEPTSTADTDKPDSLPISRPLNGSPQSSSAQNNNPFSQPQASGLGGMVRVQA